MSAFFNSVFTSVSSAASALLTPEFWAVQWPLWKMSILTCASILVFRICYRWILAFYSFIVLSPLSPFSQHPAFDKILRSSLIICLIGGVYNLCDAGHGQPAH